MDKGGVALGFRVILIESIVDMKVKLDNLVIRKEEKDIWIPMDDISMLVIDNLQITLTTRMLCILAMHNVGVVFCNQEHLPIGYYSSYDNHSRISKEIGYQIQRTEEFFKMEHRHKLVNLLNHKIQYKGKKMFLSNAMEEYVSNIAAYIAGKNVEVVFPELELYIGEDDEI